MTMSDHLRCANRNASNIDQKGKLERGWTSIMSDLSVGIPMSLEQLNMIHEVFSENSDPSMKDMLIESVQQLITEINKLKKKIQMFEKDFLIPEAMLSN
jgi:hypothetical protein